MSTIHCKAFSALTVLAFTCLIGLSLIGCDATGEQIIDWKPGNTLAIEGPADIPGGLDDEETDGVLPDTASYVVKAYTTEKDYAWTVSGEAAFNVRRGGQFIDVVFTEPGTYTIKVDDGEYVGTLEVIVSDPEE